MQMNVKTLQNESGKTAVIIAIVLAVIAYLVYPGTNSGLPYSSAS